MLQCHPPCLEGHTVPGHRICLMSCEMHNMAAQTPTFEPSLVFWGSSYLFRPDLFNKWIFGRLYFIYSRSQMFLEMYLLSETTTKLDPEYLFFFFFFDANFLDPNNFSCQKWAKGFSIVFSRITINLLKKKSFFACLSEKKIFTILREFRLKLPKQSVSWKHKGLCLWFSLKCFCNRIRKILETVW